MSLLAVQGLSHCFSGTIGASGPTGIHDITLTVEKGEFIILAGTNGSGKTTLLRHLNGLLLPDRGQIKIRGRDIGRDLPAARRAVGMVFQDADTQIVGDTVRDDIAFGLENLKTPADVIESKVNDLMVQLGLSHLENRNPATLSGGEKRRLAIAGALAMDPAVLVFDEPFANLDYPGTCTVLSAIRGLNRSGMAVILAVHDLEPVICEAHRLVILEKGRIVRDASPFDLADELEQFGIRRPCAFQAGGRPKPWPA